MIIISKSSYESWYKDDYFKYFSIEDGEISGAYASRRDDGKVYITKNKLKKMLASGEATIAEGGEDGNV